MNSGELSAVIDIKLNLFYYIGYDRTFTTIMQNLKTSNKDAFMLKRY